ncbi:MULTISPECIES: InlB B-repeat-containing protein [Gardnerella]|uniref:InlB B-repeat-containing protein n=1 Tax=Gardnerella TaxID=2701 RepID=UPI0007E344FA|nr:InlB B-repeat-containing protein [Gardnerella sp. 26-12]PMC51091.1 primosome assembly protein PriA [Gardnerella vaginalis]PMC53849.1 primosome assembly protein PriA [Gardnerella vaginalis]
MNKRTGLMLTSTMMGIATAACAFCMAQSANAAETSASSGVNTTVNSSTNNSSTTASNTETSSTEGSSSVTSYNAASNTPNGGGSALDSTSAKPSGNTVPSKSSETAKTAETTKSTKSSKASESVTDAENSENARLTQTLIDVSNTNLQTNNREDRSVHASAESKAASTDSGTTDDASLTWTKDDFNISADGKTVGGRKDVYHPETNQTVNEYVDGLSAKGKEKLKKNHHIVIPEGIEVIHECAFTGSAKQVGNKHEHIDGETYIEGVTLPQSLKIIEYGAFGWNKIKGTVVIPKNVVSVSDAAFVANEIEKVVFEGVLDDKGKEHDTDTNPYYLAGVGSVAFQGNKISDIVVKGNLGQYKFRSGENDSPFDNQNPGPFTIEVGEEYKSPIKITQESAGHTISVMEGFEENGNPVTIDLSPYFKKNADGKYVAVKTGTLEGQCIFYDFVQRVPRMIGRSHFTYNIVPKATIYTVTFVNGANSHYASVQVKEGKSINDKSVDSQSMPKDPTKIGYTFEGWNEDQDGTGAVFLASTSVNKNLKVYSIFKNYLPVITVQNKTITEGDSLDLNSLVVSVSDIEDNSITTKVRRISDGGFNNNVPGVYTITFSVTDNGGATATAVATVTVNKKPTPTPVPVPESPTPVAPGPILTPSESETEPESAPALSQPEQPEAKRVVKHLPKTGSSVAMVINYLFASVTAGIFALVEARKSLRRYSKHARKN